MSEELASGGKLKHSHEVKVVIIGLDGADWRLMDGFLKMGGLPAVAQILDEGVRAPLLSTIPDMTPPAWTSMVTGVGPGRHNVFGFSQPSARGLSLTNSKTRRAPAIWELMDERCGKLLVNIPLSFPPSPINGCEVSDSLTSIESDDWTWPRTEVKRILQLGYAVCRIPDVSSVSGVSQLISSVKVRGDVLLDLMNRYEWCFSMVVFSETDWVQHLLPGNNAAILKVYREIDRFLERLLLRLGNDNLLFLVSDHGYGVSTRKFFVNQWLSQVHLLSTSKDQAGETRFFERTSTKLAEIAPSLVRLVPHGMREKFASRMASPATNLSTASGVYASGWDIGRYLRLYITDDRRGEYDEFRTRLEAEAAKLVDKASRRKPITRVLTKGEVYQGPNIISAPDFILDLDPEFSGIDKVPASPVLFLKHKAGVHRELGVFIGKRLDSMQHKRSRILPSVSIYDVAPTVMAYFGKRIYADGQAVKELIEN